MIIKDLTYKRLVKLSQYENEEATVQATLEQGDDLKDSLTKLKSDVRAVLNPTIDASESVEVTTSNVTREDSATTVTKKVPAKKVAKKVVKKAPAKSKKKNIAYDRNVPAHKDDVALVLDEVCEGWDNEDNTLQRAKDVTVALNGEDLYDPEGNILDSFKQAVADGMADEPSGGRGI